MREATGIGFSTDTIRSFGGTTVLTHVMIGPITAAGCVLAVTVFVGLVLHECTHALVLWIGRVDFNVDFLPGRSNGLSGALTGSPLAVVTPTLTGRESPWIVRLAALAPLGLVVPAVWFGNSDAFQTGHPASTAFVLGLLACALPSPQDFSVAIYAHRLLADAPSSG